MKNNQIIDFFPYFGGWMVHHQIDYALAYVLKTKFNVEPRIYSCSHSGLFQCAINRNFIVGSEIARSTCEICKSTASSVFTQSGFRPAVKPSFSRDTLNYIANADAIEFSVLSSLDPRIDSFPQQIRLALASLIDSSLELADMTTQTHYRVSKCDLPKIAKKRLNFVRILVLEALQIAFNWSLKLPESVVIFNARFTPYNVPYYMSKLLDIPSYIHERGRKTDYSFFFNQLPSGGYGTSDLLNSHHQAVYDSLGRVSDSYLISILSHTKNTFIQPSNYPNLFNTSKTKSTRFSSDSQYLILFLTSSDDEIDCMSNLSLGQSQRNALKTFVQYTKNNENIHLVIKIHPGVYGNDQMPGMPLSQAFYDSLEQELHDIENISFLGKSSNEDPFLLVLQSDLVVGMHSSLIDFSLFHNIPTLLHKDSALSSLSQHKVDFNNSLAIKSLLADLSSFSPDLYTSKKLIPYFITRYLAFDLDISPIGISDDHFSPSMNYGQLMSNNFSINNQGLSTLCSVIYHKQNINLVLLALL